MGTRVSTQAKEARDPPSDEDNHSSESAEEVVTKPTESPSESKAGHDVIGVVEKRSSASSGSSTLYIDLAAFRNNVRLLKKMLDGTKLCAVLKSDAYGHGCVQLAREAQRAGADYIAVCDNVDARRIRKICTLPIMRCRVARTEEIAAAVDVGMEEMVGTLRDAEACNRVGEQQRKRIPLHINVDCGMGRQGFMNVEEAAAVFKLPWVTVKGIMTHFTSADEEDFSITDQMASVFDRKMSRLKELVGAAAVDKAIVHIANTAATVRGGKPYFRDMVRVGAGLYGSTTDVHYVKLPDGFKPVMKWTTHISQIRSLDQGTTVGYNRAYTVATAKASIASLPVGFGEGYPRALANKGEVIIHGTVCPIVGKVSMNVMNVDVTNCPDTAVGDEVLLMGPGMTADYLMDKCGSVHTEMQVNVGSRNCRVYINP